MISHHERMIINLKPFQEYPNALKINARRKRHARLTLKWKPSGLTPEDPTTFKYHVTLEDHDSTNRRQRDETYLTDSGWEYKKILKRNRNGAN